jgi:uncharacterized protein YjhX (UPF0386 family)
MKAVWDAGWSELCLVDGWHMTECTKNLFRGGDKKRHVFKKV